MTYYDYTLHPIYSSPSFLQQQQPQQMMNHQQQPLLDWTDPSSEEYYINSNHYNNNNNNNNQQHHNYNMDEMPSLDDVYEGLFLSFSSDNEEDQHEEAEEEQQEQQALAPIIGEEEGCDHILDPLTPMSSTVALEDDTPLGLNLNIDDELISAFWESYTKIQQSKNLQQVPITPTPAAVNPLQRELPSLRLLPLHHQHQQQPQQQSFHHQNHSFASSTSTPTTPTTPPTQFCSIQDPTPFHTNLNHNSPLLHQPLQQPTTHIFSYFKHEPIAITAPATATTLNNQEFIPQQSPQLLVQEQVLLMASDEHVRCEQSTLETEKHFNSVFDQDKRSMRRETKSFCSGTLATMTASPSSSRKRSQPQMHHHDGSNDDEQKMFSHFSILPEPAEHDWIQHGKRRKLDSNSNAASSSSHPPSSRHHHQISTTQQSSCVNDDVPAATRTRTKSFKSKALSSGGVVTTTTTTTTTTTMTRSASSSNSTTAVVSVEDKDTSDSFHVVKQRQVKQQPQLQPFYSFPEEESSFTFVQYDPHMNGSQGLVDGQRMRDKILIPNNRSSNWRKKMKKHDSFMQSFVLK